MTIESYGDNASSEETRRLPRSQLIHRQEYNGAEASFQNPVSLARPVTSDLIVQDHNKPISVDFTQIVPKY